MNDIEPIKVVRTAHAKKALDIDPDVYREDVRKIVEDCVKFLVDDPDKVVVKTYVGPKTTVFKVECAHNNLGQLIGTQGRTIMGLRAVVHAMTARAGIRSIVEIPV
ncbi:hypothetical protein D3C87_259750 [compost metagenome]